MNKNNYNGYLQHFRDRIIKLARSNEWGTIDPSDLYTRLLDCTSCTVHRLERSIKAFVTILYSYHYYDQVQENLARFQTMELRDVFMEVNNKGPRISRLLSGYDWLVTHPDEKFDNWLIYVSENLAHTLAAVNKRVSHDFYDKPCKALEYHMKKFYGYVSYSEIPEIINTFNIVNKSLIAADKFIVHEMAMRMKKFFKEFKEGKYVY